MVAVHKRKGIRRRIISIDPDNAHRGESAPTGLLVRVNVRNGRDLVPTLRAPTCKEEEHRGPIPAIPALSATAAASVQRSAAGVDMNRPATAKGGKGEGWHLVTRGRRPALVAGPTRGEKSDAKPRSQDDTQ